MIGTAQTAVRSWLARLAGIVVLTAVLAALAVPVIPAGRVCPDFLCFFSAATLVSAGESPYDASRETAVQHRLVPWDRKVDGLGIYDFMPFYYPPWVAIACIPLLPLGYPLAKITWLVLGVETLVLAAVLVRRSVPELPAKVPIALTLGFLPSLIAVGLGQLSPLVLLFIACAWNLLHARRDFAAGCALALAGTKPQVTGLVLIALLIWSLRQRRTGVVAGCLTAAVALCVVSTLIVPEWPLAMVRATRITPPPSEYIKGLGTTWLLVLKALGARRSALYGAYLALALPMLVGLARVSVSRFSRVDDVLGLGLIASFFVAPYSRDYDFPLLIVPAVILVASRLRERLGAMLVVLFLLLPLLQALWISSLEPGKNAAMTRLEFIGFWLPALLVLLWWRSGATGAARKDDALLGSSHL
jgi:hypothetical protein